MKRVLADAHHRQIYTLLQEVLQRKYAFSPLPEDSELTEQLGIFPPDLVLLTLSGADDQAFRIYDTIRKIPEMAQRPVIFIAGSSDDAQATRALAMGAADYIALPVSDELLLHRLQSGIELAELRRERPYVEKYQDAISISFAELVECRDETTGGHLKKTTGYFNILLHAAMESELYKGSISPEDVGALLRSASLHDIGKIGINDDILRKSSTLNYNEFEDMKTHTTLGKQTFEKIIKETGGTGWLYLAKDIAFCHHERWDGKGYPSGLKGEEIPLFARMLTIADVYDALTSRRAYKEAYSHQKATQIIKEGKGTYFDPELVELFLTVNKEFEEMLLINRAAL